MISKEDTQLLKGLAILMVIVEHLGQVLHIAALNPLGPIGVCLFLFISGYGLSYSYEKNGRNGYLKKRVLKVYVPYLVSVIIFSLSLFVIFATRYLKRIKCAKRVVLIVGSISYELYLAHVLPLDWLKQQVTIRNFMVYGIVFILSTLIIYLANYFVQRIGKSVMREKT